MKKYLVLPILLVLLICILATISFYTVIKYGQALAWKATPAGILGELWNPSSLADDQLMLAGIHRDAVQAEVALKNGADPNHLGLANETQLMVASQNGSVKLAEVLLKHGAKPDLMDEDGYTALMIASQFYRPEIDKMAKVLLEHGANPNLKAHGDGPKLMGTQGYTALMIACRGSTFEMVRVLLDHGADPRCVGADGKTALAIVKQRSMWREQEPTIKLLEQKLK